MAGVMREDVRFWPALLELASCLCAEIAEAGLPEPCFCGILPGDLVPLDYCQECDGGKCGMAWVRTVNIQEQRVSRYDSMEGSSIRARNCTAPLDMIVEVGVTRCAPMPESDGTPPSMAEQLDSARLVMADQAAALRAIRCCLDSKYPIRVGTWLPMGPSGGCIGGAWTVTIGSA
jgi:hypothetical protein